MRYIADGKKILANLEKNNMCSVYGKTVCKDITDKYKFITKGAASRGIDLTDVKDWEEFGD